MEEKLTLKEIMSYGAGDFAQNGMFTFISSYLLFFCTDAVGIDLEAAGLILLIGRTADALLSPFIGSVLDRSQTVNGKCKPYIRFFIFPEFLLLVLVFAVPELQESVKLLYLGTVYLLFSIAYAIMSVAYFTLLSLMTRREDERLRLNLFKNLGASMGGTLVTASVLKIVERFSPKIKYGFLFAVTGFAFVFMTAGVLCAKNTKERVKAKRTEKLNFIQAFGVTRKSRAWIVLCLIHFSELFFYSMRTQGLIYYCKYYLGRENIGAVLLTMTQIVTKGSVLGRI